MYLSTKRFLFFIFVKCSVSFWLYFCFFFPWASILLLYFIYVPLSCIQCSDRNSFVFFLLFFVLILGFGNWWLLYFSRSIPMFFDKYSMKIGNNFWCLLQLCVNFQALDTKKKRIMDDGYNNGIAHAFGDGTQVITPS